MYMGIVTSNSYTTLLQAGVQKGTFFNLTGNGLKFLYCTKLFGLVLQI